MGRGEARSASKLKLGAANWLICNIETRLSALHGFSVRPPISILRSSSTVSLRQLSFFLHLVTREQRNSRIKNKSRFSVQRESNLFSTRCNCWVSVIVFKMVSHIVNYVTIMKRKNMRHNPFGSVQHKHKINLHINFYSTDAFLISFFICRIMLQ